jgi:Glutathione S-transferase
MTPDTLRLYHSAASPNSRRVRIFLAEKDLKIPLVAVELGNGELSDLRSFCAYSF